MGGIIGKLISFMLSACLFLGGGAYLLLKLIKVENSFVSGVDACIAFISDYWLWLLIGIGALILLALIIKIIRRK